MTHFDKFMKVRHTYSDTINQTDCPSPRAANFDQISHILDNEKLSSFGNDLWLIDQKRDIAAPVASLLGPFFSNGFNETQ
jgi:hypothetical protein